MAFLTDRKRAVGMGAAGTGTKNFWSMTKSSVALLILVPLFICAVGPAIGGDLAAVQAHFSQLWVALVTGLTFAVGLYHFKLGATTMAEDYTKGLIRQIAILKITFISYGAMAAVLFALARLAL